MNERQKRFVAYYLKDPNATNAAISAGYSEKTAKQIGARLLTNVDVKAAIADGQAKLAAKLEITAEPNLGGLALVPSLLLVSQRTRVR
jgi:phage terminase small subunit